MINVVCEMGKSKSRRPYWDDEAVVIASSYIMARTAPGTVDARPACSRQRVSGCKEWSIYVHSARLYHLFRPPLMLFCTVCALSRRINTSGWRAEIEHRETRRERVLSPHQPLFGGRLQAFGPQQRLFLRVSFTTKPISGQQARVETTQVMREPSLCYAKTLVKTSLYVLSNGTLLIPTLDAC